MSDMSNQLKRGEQSQESGWQGGRRSQKERTYYHKVNLCPACAASRDKGKKKKLILAVLGLALLVAFYFGVYRSSSKTVPTTKPAPVFPVKR
jgi:hypothetical protein